MRWSTRGGDRNRDRIDLAGERPCPVWLSLRLRRLWLGGLGLDHSGGSTAAGLGYFNMGRGAYNENTAVARSINNDTYMRWNQYMYLSQQHANSLYHQHLQAEHMRVDRAQARRSRIG